MAAGDFYAQSGEVQKDVWELDEIKEAESRSRSFNQWVIFRL